VSIAFADDRAFFRTPHVAGKAKRLRNSAVVEAAPSTLRPKPIGPAIRARARLLESDEAKLAGTALARQHRVLQGLLVPLVHRAMRYRTLHSELLPVEEGPMRTLGRRLRGLRGGDPSWGRAGWGPRYDLPGLYSPLAVAS
jgi:uncharacterized protein